GQTIIYLNTPTNVFGWRATNNHSIVVDNIRFLYDQNSAYDQYGFLGAAHSSGTKTWIIHHNDFVITGTCRGYVISSDSNNGLIYRNKFTQQIVTGPQCNSVSNLNAIAHAVTDDGSLWHAASTFGSADTNGDKNLYVENNYFENFNVAIDMSTSSRVVWR